MSADKPASRSMAGSAGGGSKTFDGVAVLFCCFTDDGQRGGLTNAGPALKSVNTVPRYEHFLNGPALAGIQMRVGNGLPRTHLRLLWALRLARFQSASAGLGHNLIGLVTERGGKLPMGERTPRRGERISFLSRGGVRGDLRRFMALKPIALHILSDLLAARGWMHQGSPACSLDLRRAAASRLNLIAEIAEPIHQFRLIDGGGELLRLKQAALLQGAGLSVLALGDNEYDGVRMELRRGVTVHGTSRIMLKFCSDKLAGGLRWMVTADTRLCIPLQFRERGADGLTVGHAHAIIATDKRGEGNGFRRGECGIPSGRCSTEVTVLPSAPLYSCAWRWRTSCSPVAGLLAFRQPRKIPLRRPRRTIHIFQRACPATRRARSGLAPITLLRRG